MVMADATVNRVRAFTPQLVFSGAKTAIKRYKAAKPAALGTTEKNAVTAVGEPSYLLVEQSIKFAQTVADRHYIVEHGSVVDMVAGAELASSMERLRVYLGV